MKKLFYLLLAVVSTTAFARDEDDRKQIAKVVDKFSLTMKECPECGLSNNQLEIEMNNAKVRMTADLQSLKLNKGKKSASEILNDAIRIKNDEVYYYRYNAAKKEAELGKLKNEIEKALRKCDSSSGGIVAPPGGIVSSPGGFTPSGGFGSPDSAR